MLRRFLDALRRGRAAPAPNPPRRPNALTRESARAERLRREAEAARQAAFPPEEEGPQRRRPALPSATSAHPEPLAASLKSRSELRRALLLKEILGPPTALRWPRGGDPEP